MKILIPVLGFGPYGGFRVLSKLADELINLGHCVTFINSDTNTSPYFPTTARILWADNKGNLKPYNSNSKKATGISNQINLTKALTKLDSGAFDIIIANHSFTTIPIILAGLAYKTLYYVQAYEPEYYSSKQGFKNIILRALSTLTYKMNLFTIVNAEVYLKYKRLTASRVLYPGVDFSNFYYSPTKTVRRGENIIIGTIGRLEPQKGTYYILEAFKKIKNKYPESRLHIAFGNSNDFVDCEDVYCFQPHGDEALGEYYRSLDYYFCAGFTQLGAFHYPVVEAMSCGISLITTRYYPATNDNAWIVKSKNMEDIVEKFEMAYTNHELRQKKIENGLKDVQQFNWNIVGKTMSKYLYDLKETLVTPKRKFWKG